MSWPKSLLVEQIRRIKGVIFFVRKENRGEFCIYSETMIYYSSKDAIFLNWYQTIRLALQRQTLNSKILESLAVIDKMEVVWKNYENFSRYPYPYFGQRSCL